MDKLLTAVIDLAQHAGDAIMAIYQAEDFAAAAAVQQKADHSPLSRADSAAQQIISAGLSALTPQLPQLSEEATLPAWSERQHWPRYWLIDPLDGTKEFLQRNGEFTVNIALIEHGVPRLGVVYAPARGQLYSADVAAKQAHCNGQRIHTQPPQNPPRVLVSRSHASAADISQQQQLIALGSSLKFCLIASGAADLYQRLGPTHEWDTAAGHAIVTAAGGSVTELTGQPLRYNQKPTLINPHFIARA